MRRGSRPAKGKPQADLLGRLLEARDPETGLPMEKVELVDQVTTLLLAGHETSAAALAWMLYLLALHPAEQAAVAEEAERALSGGTADHAALSELVRTREVAREALRLYPPLPMLLREAACPERFRDRGIPAGAQIVICPGWRRRSGRNGCPAARPCRRCHGPARPAGRGRHSAAPSPPDARAGH
ncbi:cytochrome P450 [Mangrovicoccus ximenensis]|uniref:cytochrome P450 n=1 Tax=Mangrovicoccus ximenensis TaxID=1911570 RepID=UPI000D39004C